ncbi:hypothetical protein PGH07_07765 [Sulfurovum sp. zt1-1]|uniref:Concanavalin A-like lectin/glucanases superfamily protein n=1 Tax=Sulfurovum zhangzhouensis TaxID=3019067 RepID=A0ABT7QZ02_9BACT|nr:hypothetical protein [Sulfurovum zhangzhouensis]MDM5272073.1 hypothetical protein [Sulfurovum zhangzhouensis]
MFSPFKKFKNGGVRGFALYKSKYLIEYFKNGNARFFADQNSAMVVKNTGTFKNSEANASNHVYLNGVDQKFPADINYTLGSEIFLSNGVSAYGHITLTDNGDGTYNLVEDTSTLDDRVYFFINEATKNNVKVVFNANINSGTPIFDSYYDGETSTWVPLNYALKNGVNELEVKTQYPNTFVSFKIYANGANYDLSAQSVKKITSTGYLTYYDVATKQFDKIGNRLTGGGTELPRNTLGNPMVTTLDPLTCTITDNGDNTFHCITNTRYGLSKINLFNQNYSGNTGYLKDYLNMNDTFLIEVEIEVLQNNLDVYLSGFTTNEKVENLPVGTYTYRVTGKVSSIYSASVYMVCDDVDGVSEWIVKSLSIQKVLPNSTEYNMLKSFSHPFSSINAPTTREIAQLNANPDLIWQVWFDGLVLVDGFSKADITHFYDQPTPNYYLQDLAVDLGVELGHDFEDGLLGSFYDHFSASTSIIGGVANVTAGVQYSNLRLNISDAEQHIAQCFINNSSISEWYFSYLLGAITYTQLLVKGKNDILVPEGATYISIQNRSTTLLEVAEVEYFTVKSVSAKSIVNPTTTCLTNYKNTNYGASNLPIERLYGRAIVYDPTKFHFDNDGRYVNTKYLFPEIESWAIEAVITFVGDGSFHLNGRSNLYFGESNTTAGNPFIRLGLDNSLTTAVGLGDKHFILSYSKITKLMTVYINGIFFDTVGDGNYVASLSDVWLGDRSDAASYPINSNIPLYVVHKKEINDIEAQSLYNKWIGA